MSVGGETLGRKAIYKLIHRYITSQFDYDKILQIEDGAPFLMKSADEKNWVRIFFEGMDFFTDHYLRSEIQRLQVLMPDGARLRLFFPEVCGGKLFGIERLEIHEYHLREWVDGEYEIKATKIDPKTFSKAGPVRAVRPAAREIGLRKFDAKEIHDFASLSLFLRRVQMAQAA
jgi:hypothetical protein